MGENLRMMFWNCSWVAKPVWFKKSLLIMMTVAEKQLIVKPFGLYNLNLQNYSKVLNSAFSFYNLLKSFKKS
ncbi:uncharacterized protein LOC142322390 isoform X2 [Lycorma delicatula]|uniref:uncharacterized protein LOC142322390 isoform X2 n=1 Tax=Lycorma delicatula TaxID=130591 RepID=UPI003F51033F